MPNSEWYKKNKADIVRVAAAIANGLVINDGQLLPDYSDLIQSIVNTAADIVAEIDQRGIEPMAKQPKPDRAAMVGRSTQYSEEDYAD